MCVVSGVPFFFCHTGEYKRKSYWQVVKKPGTRSCGKKKSYWTDNEKTLALACTAGLWWLQRFGHFSLNLVKRLVYLFQNIPEICAL